ncbi:LuxR C-terminal-related transcriptional regulator [Gordonia humi]|uniref:DNA-binding CsgD family transcriptional regulator n=1 Tax=Gordonia humi TaxID=686429 RepID=A0A840EYW8_9ACTN|nr:LuxR C-terminal-related transcriptional regulator [Gordonia humi]MBB4134199.1 DNA-binding CsgD family transcriptional regulator [Gordonia humi]
MTGRLDHSVGVLSSSSFEADMTVGWVLSLGYVARRVTVNDLRSGAPRPKILIVDGPSISADLPPTVTHGVRVIVVGESGTVTVAGGATVVRDDTDTAGVVQHWIARVLGDGGERVQMTRREQEVLATYVLGATVRETADLHYIAECTVRTHYRRVSRRYEEIGRPIANKAQLLLAMVADGWLRLDGSLGPSAQV